MRRLVVIAIGVVGLLAKSQASETIDPQPMSNPAGRWVLIKDYSDEFNGRQLDRQKWNSNVKSWGTWSWAPDNVQVNGGKLVLQMRYTPHARDGKELFYKSGIVENVNAPIRYGYFEARIRGASRFPGVCPAFWLFKANKEKWTELDIIEMQEHQWASHRLDFSSHVWRSPDVQSTPIFRSNFAMPTWDPGDNYHVYGLLWTRSEIQWFVDGQLMSSANNDHFDQSLTIVLSLGLRPPLIESPTEDGFPTKMFVDYVRVWRNSD